MAAWGRDRRGAWSTRTCAPTPLSRSATAAFNPILPGVTQSEALIPGPSLQDPGPPSLPPGSVGLCFARRRAQKRYLGARCPPGSPPAPLAPSFWPLSADPVVASAQGADGGCPPGGRSFSRLGPNSPAGLQSPADSAGLPARCCWGGDFALPNCWASLPTQRRGLREPTPLSSRSFSPSVPTPSWRSVGSQGTAKLRGKPPSSGLVL